MDLSDLQRRLENLIRIGTIAHVDLSDTAAPRVRVRDGALLTTWLPFGALRAGTARLWSAPTVGEQVVVLAPSGELGSAVVFGSLFCSTTPAPSSAPHMHILDFADGTRWTHDDKASASVFEGMKTVLIDAKDSITLKAGQAITTQAGQTVLVKAGQTVTVDTPQTTITGKTTIKGLLAYLAGLAGSGGSGAEMTGNVKIKGNVDVIGDTKTTGTLHNNGKDVGSTHTHGGVLPGGAKTETPSA